MKHCIPPELFNAITMPADGQTAENISTFVKSEMSYRLPSVSDVMMQKEVWHVICNFCERCGALIEQKNATVNTTTKYITVTTPTYGRFQRLVGAGVNYVACSIDDITLEETPSGYKYTFADSLLSSTNKTGYLTYSVVPQIEKAPSLQTLPQWFTKKYSKVFVAGGLYRILSMQNRPWTDITTARLFAVEYNNEIERISRSLLTSGMRKYIRVGTEDLLVATSANTANQAQTA